MSKANEKQVGGSHYGGGALQHWDVVDKFKLDYFQGQITKYVMRWKDKNGLEDLKKARHFLDKYIELNSPKSATTSYMIGSSNILPVGWTVEGYHIRDGVGVQTYKCGMCKVETVARTAGEAVNKHIQAAGCSVTPSRAAGMAGVHYPPAGASEGRTCLQDNAEQADLAGATGAYVNQGCERGQL